MASLAKEEVSLALCKICERNFAVDRIERHESICEKVAQKPRKVFDVTKHRIKGTDVEEFIKRAWKTPKARTVKQQATPPKKTNWRQQHEEFITAIRAAKELKEHLANGGKLSDLPPPPPSSNPDYIQCPHCQRRFNQAAAERHIPKCATFQHNKPKQAPSAGRSSAKFARR